MTSRSSDLETPAPDRAPAPPAPTNGGYSCDEPWTGLFSIETNLDVTFCPCYLKLKIGNLDEAPLREIWNAAALVTLREAFGRGELPTACATQLCPVALGSRG